MKKQVLLSLFLASIVSIACTGILVGKNATEDGSAIMARNEDLSGSNTKTFVVKKALENKKGSIFYNPDTNFTWNIEGHSYKYFYTPDADSSYGEFGEAGFNEHGLGVSTTISAKANEKALKVDPYVKGGITEADMAGLLLAKTKTPREAIEYLAKIIDEKGAGEGNILYVGNSDEIWYMEIYTGHQYIAIRVPDDGYAIIANTYMLENADLNDKKNTIHSKNLLQLAKENKFLVTLNGKNHFAKTYGPSIEDYDRVRVWGGKHLLSKSKNIDYYSDDFKFIEKADKKISLKDVMAVLRYRYEGTRWDPSIKGNEDIRTIGHQSDLESHIFQFRKEGKNIMWLAMGGNEFAPYIPYAENIYETIDELHTKEDTYNDKSFYWIMKELNVYGAIDRKDTGLKIKKTFSELEKEFIEKQIIVDKKIKNLSEEEQAKYLTKYSKELATKTFEMAKKLKNEIITDFAKNNFAK